MFCTLFETAKSLWALVCIHGEPFLTPGAAGPSHLNVSNLRHIANYSNEMHKSKLLHASAALFVRRSRLCRAFPFGKKRRNVWRNRRQHEVKCYTSNLPWEGWEPEHDGLSCFGLDLRRFSSCCRRVFCFRPINCITKFTPKLV